MPNIKVVGQTATYDLETVKDSVIQLGGKWYFKHDDTNLVKVKTSEGLKLFRKESPLLCTTVDGELKHKKDCVEIDPGIWLYKTSPNTIKLDNGKITHRNWVVNIHNKPYLKSDERIVKTRTGDYALKSEVIELAPSYYGKNVYTVRDHTLVELDGSYYLQDDLRKVTSWNDKDGVQEFKYVTKATLLNGKYSNNVFAGFKDVSNPQIGRIEVCFAKSTDITPFPPTGGYCLTKDFEHLSKLFEELAVKDALKNTEDIRKKINAKFSDLGDDENKAKLIDKNFTTWGGKQHLFGHIGEPIYSRRYDKTGGLGYTFGVELETSAGVLPHKIADELGINAVGDRSIGAAEYVTTVLQGNKGIKHLEEVCKALAAHTFVDDRCGVHVHVGSPEQVTSSNWTVNFDWRFAVAAIKLGCSIEEDLYKMLPKSRSPYNRHCHSILRYRDINEKNWREMLGDFVFGPEENWGRTHDMRQYRYGEDGYNKSHGLSNWCGGRYKWLNLVRAYSKCNSPTFEIRIWSPSTNFDKVYNYVLLTLAFVYVTEHNYVEIMANEINLRKMIEIAYADYPDLIKRLYSFIDERVTKFDRKVIYTGAKPEDIVSII